MISFEHGRLNPLLNQNTPNDKNISVNSKLNGSGNGFYQEPGTKNNAVSKVNHKGTGIYTNNIDTTFKGWIGLTVPDSSE